MNKSTYIIALAILCTCAGCGTSRKLISTTQQDSVRVEIVERFVTIRDTVAVEIPSEKTSAIVPTDSTSYLENSVAESTASVKNGLLSHSLNTKPVTLEKEVESQVAVRDSIVYKEVKITDYIEVPRDLTWWQETRMRGFWILLMVVLGYVAIKRFIPFV